MNCGCLIYPLCGCCPAAAPALPDAWPPDIAPAPAPWLSTWVEPAPAKVRPAPSARDEVDAELEREERIAASVERLRALEEDIGRSSLYEFFKLCWEHVLEPTTPFEKEWHLKYVADHLEAMLRDWMAARTWRDAGGEASGIPEPVQRAINACINIAPRSGKSTLLLCVLPWMWTQWPSWQMICLSCNDAVLIRDAKKTIEILTSDWYRTTFQIQWELTSDALGNITNTLKGSRDAQTLNSAIVGQGYNLILLDDPMEPKQSIYAKYRETTNINWDLSYGRVNDPRIDMRVIVMQMVDADDLSAHVLASRAQKWQHLALPVHYKAAYSKVTFLGLKDPRTVEDEILHPRYTEDYLAAQLEVLGSYRFACQFEQRPFRRDGAKVPRSWWRFYKLDGYEFGTHKRPHGCNDEPAYVVPLVKGIRGVALPATGATVEAPAALGGHQIPARWDLDWTKLTVDPATKKTDEGSNYGMLAVAAKDQRRFVLDDRTKRDTFPEIRRTLEKMIADWNAREAYIEAKVAGGAAGEELTERIREGKVVNAEGQPIACKIKPVDVGGNDGEKGERMDACSPQLEAGWVYLPEGAPWVAAFIDELERFPAKPNDRGDALSQILNEEKSGGTYAERISKMNWSRALG